MAGYHQLWGITLDGSNFAKSISGNGFEKQQDSPDPKLASFAQPSGLASLFVAKLALPIFDFIAYLLLESIEMKSCLSQIQKAAQFVSCR